MTTETRTRRTAEDLEALCKAVAKAVGRKAEGKKFNDVCAALAEQTGEQHDPKHVRGALVALREQGKLTTVGKTRSLVWVYQAPAAA